MPQYPDIPSVKHAAMFQTWSHLTFLHWRWDAAELQRRLPAGLEIDMFDGSAWLGITPFLLENLRAPGLPALPWISRFPETNCRTYVRGAGGYPAIWFFSLDAARLAAVAGARLLYGLPYAWSRMQVEMDGNEMRYASARRWPDRVARTAIAVERGVPLEPGPLEIFLTARYRLYSTIRGRLVYAQVEHEPWPLERARVITVEQTLTRAAGLPSPEGQPLAHFSSGVTTRIGPPEEA